MYIRSRMDKLRERLLWEGEDYSQKGTYLGISELLPYSPWPTWWLHKCFTLCTFYMCVFCYHEKMFVYRCVPLSPDCSLKILFPTKKKQNWFLEKMTDSQCGARNVILNIVSYQIERRLQRLLGSCQKDTGTKVKRLTLAEKRTIWASISSIKHSEYV